MPGDGQPGRNIILDALAVLEYYLTTEQACGGRCHCQFQWEVEKGSVEADCLIDVKGLTISRINCIKNAFQNLRFNVDESS